MTGNRVDKWLIYFDMSLINAAYETSNVTVQEF